MAGALAVAAWSLPSEGLEFTSEDSRGVASVVEGAPKVVTVPLCAPPEADWVGLAERVDPPGSFVEHPVPRVAAGMQCPDGTFLPPLNGVTVDDPIPRIQRSEFMAPIGAIIGKFTDAAGDAWWVTEDGSAFTTRFCVVESAGGVRTRIVRLDQADRLPAGFAVGG